MFSVKYFFKFFEGIHGDCMGRGKTMAELQEIIVRLKMGQSIRLIRKNTGSHRATIRILQKIAAKHQWLIDGAPPPSEELIRKALAEEGKIKRHPLEAYSDQIKEWLKAKMSFVVMHSIIKEQYDCHESTFRRFVHKNFPKYIVPVMVREHSPGEFADADFGFLGVFFDEETNTNRKVWFFSLRLRYSRKTYREAVFDQSERTFALCHIHALEYFFGVPQTVVIDNLKAGVIKASAEEPLINKSYLELAQHYDFIVSACRPYTPRHKGGVENDVKYVKNNFLAIFREKQKQKGIEIPSVSDLKKSLEEWNDNVAETRTIGGVGKTVKELFAEEKTVLKQLPQERWDPAEWGQAKVGRDWRVKYCKVFYSVPYKLIGQIVQIRADRNFIRVYHKGVEVALHRRSYTPLDYVRDCTHAPLLQEEVLYTSRAGLLAKAESLGVLYFVEKMFDKKNEERLHAVRRFLNLAKKYGIERLQKSCQRASHFELFSYGSVKSILKDKLDSLEIGASIPEQTRKEFRYARNKQDFEKGETNE